MRIKGDENRFGGFAPFRLDVTREIREGKPVCLEATYTRRNTFGPLHLIPALAFAYSDCSFKTTGSEFTTDYAIVPAGFVKGIRLVKAGERR